VGLHGHCSFLQGRCCPSDRAATAFLAGETAAPLPGCAVALLTGLLLPLDRDTVAPLAGLAGLAWAGLLLACLAGLAVGAWVGRCLGDRYLVCEVCVRDGTPFFPCTAAVYALNDWVLHTVTLPSWWYVICCGPC
jgi:hypothetical protein